MQGLSTGFWTGVVLCAAVACLPQLELERGRDADGDGVLDWADCDDADAGIGTPGVEICNGLDDDCDGEIDEDAIGGEIVSPDLDGDGFGQDGVFETVCGLRPGYSKVGTDCDDEDPTVHPEAPERCNDVDDDCNGRVDEDPVDGQTWFHDADRDGFGGEVAVWACEPPEHHISLDGDCDDFTEIIHPAAAERCNQLDDDCDGVVDEGCR